MSDRLTVWLIRHPAPAIAPGVCYGQLDVELAEAAADVATRLWAELPALDAVFSSPLTRCRQLAGLLHAAPCFDARLQEINFGDWEGRRWDDIDRADLDAWAADVFGFAPPGGESARAMAARVVSFAADFPSLGGLPAPLADLRHVAIVAHQGPLRVLAAHWRGELKSLESFASRWQETNFAFGSAVPVVIQR